MQVRLFWVRAIIWEGRYHPLWPICWSGPTLDLAARLPQLRAVVLHSPILSGLRVMYPVKRTYWFDIYKNIDKIPLVNCPVLIIHVSKQVVCIKSALRGGVVKASGLPFPPLLCTSNIYLEESNLLLSWLISMRRKYCCIWISTDGKGDMAITGTSDEVVDCSMASNSGNCHLKKFVSTVEKSPSQRNSSRRSTDQFEQSRRSTDVFEVSRKSTDRREKQGRALTGLKNRKTLSNNADKLEKLRMSLTKWKGLGEVLIAMRSPGKALTTNWKELGRVWTDWNEYELASAMLDHRQYLKADLRWIRKSSFRSIIYNFMGTACRWGSYLDLGSSWLVVVLKHCRSSCQKVGELESANNDPLIRPYF
ncbi:Protein ABHD17A [Vitis vinifera]|uniref:Protein ABHD17A n=1 Tax=Vitis vinifera TaxID=29760 RepID=A0A438CR58_VITVI|nr:Protein ABHD17A [Vitis vinifera]